MSADRKFIVDVLNLVNRIKLGESTVGDLIDILTERTWEPSYNVLLNSVLVDGGSNISAIEVMCGWGCNPLMRPTEYTEYVGENKPMYDALYQCDMVVVRLLTKYSSRINYYDLIAWIQSMIVLQRYDRVDKILYLWHLFRNHEKYCVGDVIVVTNRMPDTLLAQLINNNEFRKSIAGCSSAMLINEYRRLIKSVGSWAYSISEMSSTINKCFILHRHESSVVNLESTIITHSNGFESEKLTSMIKYYSLGYLGSDVNIAVNLPLARETKIELLANSMIGQIWKRPSLNILVDEPKLKTKNAR